MPNQGPIQMSRAGVTEEIKEAISAACGSVYGLSPHNFVTVAYSWESLMMYSVSAFSKMAIAPSDIDLDAIKSAFLNSLPAALPATEIVFGYASYPAPSLVKFLIIVHT